MSVSAITQQPVVEDGKVVIGSVTTLGLSVDHRVVDGVKAAQFLGEIRRLLEHPDELVEDGRSGLLVPIGDAAALAEALVRAWRGELPWLGDRFVRPAILNEMAPQVAAENLIRFSMREEAGRTANAYLAY